MTFRAAAVSSAHLATTTSDTVTISVPTAVAAGDVMLVVGEMNDAAATFTISGGGTVTWTSRSGPDDLGTTLTAQVWTATAAADSAGATITIVSSVVKRINAAFIAHHSVNESGLVAGLASITPATTALAFPSVTVNADGSDLVGLAAVRPDGNQVDLTYTPPADVTVDALSHRNDGTAVRYDALALHKGTAVGTGAQTLGTVTASGAGGTALLYTVALEPVAGAGSVSAGLSGSGTLSGAASPAVTTGAALSGAGTLAAEVFGRVAAILSGSGALTAGATPAVAAAGGLSGSGSLAAVAQPAVVLAAALSGTGALLADPRPGYIHVAALSGSGALLGKPVFRVSAWDGTKWVRVTTLVWDGTAWLNRPVTVIGPPQADSAVAGFGRAPFGTSPFGRG